MLPQKLDQVFDTACDAVIEGLQSNSDEAVKARPQLIKGAVELLKFAGHELALEGNDKARQVTELASLDDGNVVEADFSLPFDGEDKPVSKESG